MLSREEEFANLLKQLAKVLGGKKMMTKKKTKKLFTQDLVDAMWEAAQTMRKESEDPNREMLDTLVCIYIY
jgi:hypothetical protein